MVFSDKGTYVCIFEFISSDSWSIVFIFSISDSICTNPASRVNQVHWYSSFLPVWHTASSIRCEKVNSYEIDNLKRRNKFHMKTGTRIPVILNQVKGFKILKFYKNVKWESLVKYDLPVKRQMWGGGGNKMEKTGCLAGKCFHPQTCPEVDLIINLY